MATTVKLKEAPVKLKTYCSSYLAQFSAKIMRG